MNEQGFLCDGIRYLRLSTEMKQKELADAIGIERSRLSQYENKHAMPTIEILNKICNKFNVPADYFYFDEIFRQGADTLDESKDDELQSGNNADIEADTIFDDELYSNEMPKNFGKKI